MGFFDTAEEIFDPAGAKRRKRSKSELQAREDRRFKWAAAMRLRDKWTDAERDAEEEALRAEINRRLVAGEVTTCAPAASPSGGGNSNDSNRKQSRAA